MNIQYNKIWFFFILLYVVIDYGRVQHIFSIDFLKPALIINLILIGFLVFYGKLIPFKNRQIKLIWLFIILLATHIPLARNYYFAFKATEVMLFFMPLILSTIICVTSLKRLKTIIHVYLSLMVFISLYYLFQKGAVLGEYFRDENDLALYINTWIPFCFFLISVEKEKIIKFLYIIGLTIGLLAIVSSTSRGGFVGLVSMALIAFLYSKQKLKSLVIIILLCLIVYNYAGETYWQEMSTLTESHTTADANDDTARGRILSWKAGWNIFLDHPLGVGGQNFNVWFPEYQSSEFKKNMWGRAAHSLWFTLIPELGVLGIIIYLALLYFNLKDLFFLKDINQNSTSDFNYLNSLSRAFIASLTGHFVSATFISVLYYPHYWYLTALLIAMKKISKELSLPNGPEVVPDPKKVILLRVPPTK